MLGAQLAEGDGTLTCSWPGAPLTVVVERGEIAGPVGLRMRDTPELPAEDGVGPAVLPVT